MLRVTANVAFAGVLMGTVNTSTPLSRRVIGACSIDYRIIQDKNQEGIMIIPQTTTWRPWHLRVLRVRYFRASFLNLRVAKTSPGIYTVSGDILQYYYTAITKTRTEKTLKKPKIIILSLTAVAAILPAAFCAACNKAKGSGNTTDSPVSSSEYSNGAYWKAVDTDDWTADIFLWEDGKGFFRFIQGSDDENDEGSLYGFRDTFSCNWTLEGGTLTLTGSRSGEIIYQGVISGGRLSIPYDDMGVDTIIMEKTPMPPYGAQWDMAVLYDTSWRMVSYTDRAGTASFDNGIFSTNDKDEGRYVYSELRIQPTYLVDFYLFARDNSKTGSEKITLDGLSIKRTSGALWKDCANKAWFTELNNDGRMKPSMGISYADGKLFLKRGDGRGVFPDSFTAVYEQLDIDSDRYEWDE